MELAEMYDVPSMYRLYIYLEEGSILPKEYRTSSPFTAVKKEIETLLEFAEVESVMLVQLFYYGEEEREYVLTRAYKKSAEKPDRYSSNLTKRNLDIPMIGSLWVWEKDKPHAREDVVVTAVNYNDRSGDVLVETERSDRKAFGNHKLSAWNDLDRFWEAVTPYNSTAE